MTPPNIDGYTVILGANYEGSVLPSGTKVWSNHFKKWLNRSQEGLKSVILEYWFAIPNT